MKKKVVSLLIAGLMMLEPCTMADAADLSDTEVIEQSVESAGDSVETEAMGETPEETGDIAESGAQDTEVSEEGSVDEEELSLDEGAEAVQDVNEEEGFGDGEEADFSDNAEAATDVGASIQKSGRLSKTVTWDFYDNGELVINGTGAVPDMPDGLFTQPWAAFDITRVKVSDGISTLGANTFASMLYLEEVELGKNVKKIGTEAFYNDTVLKKINFPDGLTSVGDGAFWFCGGLEGELKLPKSITSIGKKAFNGCDSLKSIVLPESLREIPAGAFQYDYNVKRIFIPASITKIDKTAFEGCDPSVIQYTGTQAQWKKLQLDTVFNPDFMNIEYNFASDKVDEHIWSQEREWDGEDPYDCTVARTKSYHCIVCGAIDERSTVTVPGKEHTWSAEKIYDEKNDMDFYDCTKGGTKSYHCKECGAIDKDSTEPILPRSAHSYGPWEVTQEATISQPEKKMRTCKVCYHTSRITGNKLTPTIKVSRTAVTLNPQQKLTSLYVTYKKGDSVVSWKSSNTKVATVTKQSNGKCVVVAGKTPGKATLTVTLKSNKKAYVTVTVRSVKTTKITGVKSSLVLRVKKTATLKPVLTPRTSTEKITYKSSNTKVATVTSAGKIIAKKKGTAYIYVKSGSKTVKCKVVVK